MLPVCICRQQSLPGNRTEYEYMYVKYDATVISTYHHMMKVRQVLCIRSYFRMTMLLLMLHPPYIMYQTYMLSPVLHPHHILFVYHR